MRNLIDTVVIDGEMNDIKIDGELSLGTAVDGEADFIYGASGGVPEYQGEYEITPTPAEQNIPIQGMMATQDITIKPIPSNYGLITWDGHTLTVS